MKLDSATVQREVMATESKDEQPAQSNMVIGGDALQTVAILDATASLVETAGALFRVLHSTDKQPKVCQNVIEDIHEVRNPNDVEGTMAGKSRTTIPHILNEGKQTVSKSFVSEESRKASQMGNEVLLVPAVSEEVSIPSHPAALLEHHEVSPALTESSKTLDSLKNSFTTPESEGLVAQAFICNESNLATSYLSTWECLLDYIRAVHGASAAILEVPGIGISYLHRIKSLHDTCELVRIKCELPNNRSTNNEQLYVFKRADQGLLGNTDNMRREIGLFLTMPLHENIMKIDYLVTRRLVGQLTTKITQGEIRNGQSCITECEKGDVICGFLTKYIPTGTLGRTLRRRCAEGSFYWSIRMSWALQLCDAFYHIHHVAKTYHGGCKPDNILIDDRDGKGGKLIVIDFEHLKSTKLFRSRWLTYYYTTPDDRMYNDLTSVAILIWTIMEGFNNTNVLHTDLKELFPWSAKILAGFHTPPDILEALRNCLNGSLTSFEELRNTLNKATCIPDIPPTLSSHFKDFSLGYGASFYYTDFMKEFRFGDNLNVYRKNIYDADATKLDMEKSMKRYTGCLKTLLRLPARSKPAPPFSTENNTWWSFIHKQQDAPGKESCRICGASASMAKVYGLCGCNRCVSLTSMAKRAGLCQVCVEVSKGTFWEGFINMSTQERKDFYLAPQSPPRVVLPGSKSFCPSLDLDLPSAVDPAPSPPRPTPGQPDIHAFITCECSECKTITIQDATKKADTQKVLTDMNIDSHQTDTLSSPGSSAPKEPLVSSPSINYEPTGVTINSFLYQKWACCYSYSSKPHSFDQRLFKFDMMI